MAETKTADDIRGEIGSAFDAYMVELEQAGPHWERKPGAGEGEDAWCARQVAEHIAGASLFFGSGVAQAIGVAGPELQRVELPDASAASSRTRDNQAAFMAVIAQVRDQQLGMEIDHPRLGKQTLEGILGIVTYHHRDHANQLKTLRES
ncbi:MAG: DinB family protein [Tepidiformaceae bacterium]